MTGKICVVTGANRGIGLCTALGLARLDSHVVLVCRNEARGIDAVRGIKTRTGNRSISLFVADLSNLDSVRTLAGELNSEFPTIDVLVNNAAILVKERVVTADGLELQLAVNHLAPFLLTNLLKKRIEASDSGRIVNVSSNAHRRTSLDFSDLQNERTYRGTRVYSQTKLMNILFANELAVRLGETRVTVNSLHPGVVETGLLEMFFPAALRGLAGLVGMSAEKGAENSLYLATSHQVAGVTGKYFSSKKVVSPSRAALDLETGKRLWQVSEELTGASW